MRHPLIIVSPLCVSSSVHIETALFMTYVGAWQVANPDKVRDVFMVPESGCTPAPVARNRIVKKAMKYGADFLLMVDDDMVPCHAFFERAMDFLKKQDTPSIIGSPYCCAPPQEDVMVFEFASGESHAPTPHWKLERIRREDAVRRKGIGRVANIGTGLVMYDMRIFDRIEPPYFDYNYNPDHTTVGETEDCFFHRRAGSRGIPIYCDWDSWSGHCKSKVVQKPHLIDTRDVDGLFIREAMENLKAIHLLPTDIPGNETTQDLAEVYRMAVEEAPDGGRFVEVGSWLGRSTILMAQLIKRSGKRIELYAVDTFKGSPSEEQQQIAAGWEGGSVRAKFDQNLERYAVKDCVQVCPLPSTDAAILFDDDSLDFAYIDAEHTEEAVTKDIAAWRKKIKPGGTLAGHDFDWPGVRAAVEKSLPMAEVVIIGGRSWVWKKKG